jgi:hypothetical protein
MRNVLRKWLVTICFVTLIGLVIYKANQKIYDRECAYEVGMVTSDACQLVCKFYYTGKINSEIELPIKTIMKIQTIEKAYTYSMYDFLHNKKVSEDIIETVYREVLRRYPESLFTINKIEIRLY